MSNNDKVKYYNNVIKGYFKKNLDNKEQEKDLLRKFNLNQILKACYLYKGRPYFNFDEKNKMIELRNKVFDSITPNRNCSIILQAIVMSYNYDETAKLLGHNYENSLLVSVASLILETDLMQSEIKYALSILESENYIKIFSIPDTKLLECLLNTKKTIKEITKLKQESDNGNK